MTTLMFSKVCAVGCEASRSAILAKGYQFFCHAKGSLLIACLDCSGAVPVTATLVNDIASSGNQVIVRIVHEICLILLTHRQFAWCRSQQSLSLRTCLCSYAAALDELGPDAPNYSQCSEDYGAADQLHGVSSPCTAQVLADASPRTSDCVRMLMYCAT